MTYMKFSFKHNNEFKHLEPHFPVKARCIFTRINLKHKAGVYTLDQQDNVLRWRSDFCDFMQIICDAGKQQIYTIGSNDLPAQSCSTCDLKFQFPAHNFCSRLQIFL